MDSKSASAEIVSSLQIILYHIKNVYKLARRLLRKLIAGTSTWLYMLSRLVIYTAILLPGFLDLLRYWAFSTSLIRNVPYAREGSKRRNLLDIYVPYVVTDKSINVQDLQRPVVVFVSGGAWTIGYKMWSCLCGRALSRMGYVVVMPDYRNYPQATIEGMMADVRMSLKWTIQNISKYGGSAKNIILAGQSAGAHISLCVLIDEYSLAKEKDAGEEHVAETDDNTTVNTIDNENGEIADIPQLCANGAEDHDDLVSSSDEEDDGDEPSIVWRRSSEGAKGRRSERIRSQSGQFGEDECNGRRRSWSRSIPYLDEIMQKPLSHNSSAFAEQEKADILDSVRLYVGVSGPYNLESTQQHLHGRGLDSSLLEFIFLHDLAKYSPSLRLDEMIAGKSSANMSTNAVKSAEKRAGVTQAESLLPGFPPVALMHGSADATCPISESESLLRVLQRAGVDVSLCTFPAWTHTDPILEGPMREDGSLFDEMHNAIIGVLGSESKSLKGTRFFAESRRRPVGGNVIEDLCARTEGLLLGAKASDEVKNYLRDTERDVVIPATLIRIARTVNPF